jgi:hypothetical protein
MIEPLPQQAVNTALCKLFLALALPNTPASVHQSKSCHTLHDPWLTNCSLFFLEMLDGVFEIHLKDGFCTIKQSV